jgi:flagellar biosynthesis/type III secretory pathway protein FliH
MNSLFSSAETADSKNPISLFDYQDMQSPPPSSPCESEGDDKPDTQEANTDEPPGLTPQEVESLVAQACVKARAEARAEALEEARKKLRGDYEAKLASERNKINETIQSFAAERKNYYSRVEADIVKLSLAIAAKILHREAQVDPLLLAALVRVAVERLQEGSKVSARVHPEKAESWRKAFAHTGNGVEVTIVEDLSLDESDCVLEADIGSTNFSIDSQLKEIEQGFFDLLAQRPS